MMVIVNLTMKTIAQHSLGLARYVFSCSLSVVLILCSSAAYAGAGDSGNEIENWWIFDDGKKTNTELLEEANALGAIQSNAKRILIVGNGAVADRLYEMKVRKLGAENVFKNEKLKTTSQMSNYSSRNSIDLVLGMRSDATPKYLPKPRYLIARDEADKIASSALFSVTQLKLVENLLRPKINIKYDKNDREKLSKALSVVQDVRNFVKAVELDQTNWRSGDQFILWKSHTMETLTHIVAREGIKKLAEHMLKQRGIEKGGSTFGADKIFRGVSRGIRDGRYNLKNAKLLFTKGYADVENVELILDGVVGITTAFAVYFGTRNIERAKLASDSAMENARLGRSVTHSTFMWRLGSMESHIKNYNDALNNSIKNNLPVPKPHDFFSKDVYRAFNGKIKEQLAKQAHSTSMLRHAIYYGSYFKAPSYETFSDNTQQTKMLANKMASRSTKLVVFGNTKQAHQEYKNSVQRIGETNVKWVKSMPSSYNRQRIASSFGADAIRVFRSESWREVTTNGYKTRIPITPGNNMLTPNIQSSQSHNVPRQNQQLQTTNVKNKPVDFRRSRNEYVPSFNYPWSGGPPEDGPGGGGVSPIQRTSFSSIDRTLGQVFPQTHRVGGVMLNGAAKVSGADNELGTGSFSLLFENGDAGMDVSELRKFVTALWAVYFSQEGPGISIDPIAPNIDKHMVRYIGQVVNSDLGRVMREADYTMKKWAVGTERPQLAGFRNPDDIAGKRGSMGAQAWSRFWFVPEDMRFRKSGDMLLFDGGRMTLKTEYLSRRMRGETDSANEQFANEFTQSYPLVSQTYPVFQELFDYAKMVSLAKYLKENGIPMLWYLLANKDMILTEDSPGTVNALAKKSKYFEAVEITGGVDLAAKPSSSNYVIDSAAAKALSKAASRYRASSKGSSFSSNNTVVFETGDEAYSLVAPENVVLSGSSVSGETFQTDIALRNSGMPGLELARYYNPEYKDIATFGKGWHLMIPYKLEPEGTEMIPFANAMVPEKMVVKNLLSGQEETLTFDKERYNLPGYVPDDAELSSLVGIFWLSNGSLRLADKVGSEFQFDPSGRLTDMILTKNYTVSYEYGYESVEADEFRRSPYHIKPMGRERVSALNVTLPKRMQLVNDHGRVIDTFVFDQDNKHEIIGYSPEAANDSNYEFMALLSDGSFQLEANKGQVIAFNAAGRFELLKEPVVKKMVKGKHEIRFDYEYDGENGFRIGDARVMKKGGDSPLYASRYTYGYDGRLASVKQPSGNKVKIDYGHNTIKVASR